MSSTVIHTADCIAGGCTGAPVNFHQQQPRSGTSKQRGPTKCFKWAAAPGPLECICATKRAAAAAKPAPCELAATATGHGSKPAGPCASVTVLPPLKCASKWVLLPETSVSGTGCEQFPEIRVVVYR